MKLWITVLSLVLSTLTAHANDCDLRLGIENRATVEAAKALADNSSSRKIAVNVWVSQHVAKEPGVLAAVKDKGITILENAAESRNLQRLELAGEPAAIQSVVAAGTGLRRGLVLVALDSNIEVIDAGLRSLAEELTKKLINEATVNQIEIRPVLDHSENAAGVEIVVNGDHDLARLIEDSVQGLPVRVKVTGISRHVSAFASSAASPALLDELQSPAQPYIDATVYVHRTIETDYQATSNSLSHDVNKTIRDLGLERVGADQLHPANRNVSGKVVTDTYFVRGSHIAVEKLIASDFVAAAQLSTDPKIWTNVIRALAVADPNQITQVKLDLTDAGRDAVIKYLKENPNKATLVFHGTKNHSQIRYPNQELEELTLKDSVIVKRNIRLKLSHAALNELIEQLDSESYVIKLLKADTAAPEKRDFSEYQWDRSGKI